MQKTVSAEDCCSFLGHSGHTKWSRKCPLLPRTNKTEREELKALTFVQLMIEMRINVTQRVGSNGGDYTEYCLAKALLGY